MIKHCFAPALLVACASPVLACDELPLGNIGPGAYVVVPDTYCSTIEFTVPSTATLDTRGWFSSYGGITVDQGSIVSNATFENVGGLALVNSGNFLSLGSYGGSGGFYNEGSAAAFSGNTDSSGGELVNAGLLTIGGTFDSTGNFFTSTRNFSVGTTYVNGTLRAYAAFSVDGGALMAIEANASVQLMSGAIAQTLGGSLDVGGQLYVAPNAQLTLGASFNGPYQTFRPGGSLLIDSSGQAAVAANTVVTMQGTLHNYGQLTVGGQLAVSAPPPPGGPIGTPTLYNHFGGQLTVAPGGVLHVDTLLVNESQATLDTQGTVELTTGATLQNESHWTNSGEVFIWGSVVGGGDYLQTAGTTHLDGLLQQSRFDLLGGRLCGNGSLDAPLFINGGSLCPGNSPGRLTLLQTLDFTAGTIELQIAGTAAGQYDVLDLRGATVFGGGNVHLSFIDGYLPQAGDHWQLMIFGGAVSGMGNLTTFVDGLPDGYLTSVQLGANGFEFTVDSVTAVPEPSPWQLWAVAALLATSVGAGRRRGR